MSDLFDMGKGGHFLILCYSNFSTTLRGLAEYESEPMHAAMSFFFLFFLAFLFNSNTIMDACKLIDKEWKWSEVVVTLFESRDGDKDAT